MDGILASIILPPSRDLLALLDVCYMLTLVVYIPFFALTVGSMLLSIFFRLTAGENDYKNEFARELLLQIFPERHYGILYGAVPVFTVAVVYAQSLYKAEIHVVEFIFSGILTAFAGFYFFYKYRTTLRNEHIQNQVLKLDNLPTSLRESVEQQKGTTVYTCSWMMILAPIFVLLTAYQIVGSMEIVLHPEYWASTTSSWQFVVHVGFWWKFLFFLASCFAVTGAAILFFICKSYNNHLSDEAASLAKAVGAGSGLYGAISLPLLGLFYSFSMSATAYSNTFVLVSIAALFFIFLASARMAGAARALHRPRGSTSAFVLIIIGLTLFSAGETVAKKNATMKHVDSILPVPSVTSSKNDTGDKH